MDNNQPSRASFIMKLSNVQASVKAAKSHHNKFGGYSYRNCADIMEALKPYLDGLAVVISDEMVEVGGRVYLKATVTVTDGVNEITNSAYAREAEAKKGMDVSQITGATSSYARKYALEGMFLVDNNKDADSMDNRNQYQNHQQTQQYQPPVQQNHQPTQPTQAQTQLYQAPSQTNTQTPQATHNDYSGYSNQRRQSRYSGPAKRPSASHGDLISPQQVQDLQNALKASSMTEDQLCRAAKVGHINLITVNEFGRAKNWIKRKTMAA